MIHINQKQSNKFLYQMLYNLSQSTCLRTLDFRLGLIVGWSSAKIGQGMTDKESEMFYQLAKCIRSVKEKELE